MNKRTFIRTTALGAACASTQTIFAKEQETTIPIVKKTKPKIKLGNCQIIAQNLKGLSADCQFENDDDGIVLQVDGERIKNCKLQGCIIEGDTSEEVLAKVISGAVSILVHYEIECGKTITWNDFSKRTKEIIDNYKNS